MLPSKSQTKGAAHSRQKAELSTRLDSQLLAYATAASAAGVAALAAAATPAAAEVVYTPTHIVIADEASYALDLNHDGIADFTLQRCRCPSSHFSVLLLDLDVPNNAFVPP